MQERGAFLPGLVILLDRWNFADGQPGVNDTKAVVGDGETQSAEGPLRNWGDALG